MPTTQADIQGWLKEAKREKATHLIVVCDSFDHEDYPVLVKPGQDPKERASEYQNKDMQRGVRAPPRLGHSAQGVPLVSLRDASCKGPYEARSKEESGKQKWPSEATKSLMRLPA